MNEVYFIEGNIAAGKSTLLDDMARCMNSVSGRPCVVVKEPVEDWSRSLLDDDGILQLYYKDKKTYGFGFQANVIISQMTQLLRVMRENPTAIIFAERSPSSGDIFARQMVAEGILSPVEFALHEQWIRMSEEMIKTAGIVYLRVSPDKCMERLQVRARRGESLIDRSLIDDLHVLHELYIDGMQSKGHRVLILDGDADNVSQNHTKLLRSFLLQRV